MDQENVQEAIRIARLIYDKNRGVLSNAEEAELEQWLVASPENSRLYAALSGDPDQEEILRKLRQYDARAALDKTFQQIRQSEGRTGKSIRKLLFYASVAAALLIAAAIALYFNNGTENGKPQPAGVAAAEIQPGGNRATLTLANGTKINLDSAKAGIQINDEHIAYNDGTKIEAQEGHRAPGTYNVQLTTYNTVATPRGGQYQIVLSDGTKVWLNAASTLKYPSKFSSDRREVRIEGEAYFEVNNGSRAPFIVLSGKQEILVLGTAFNVNAYEPETKTTLINGKVQVKANNIQLLSPGEQSVLSYGVLNLQKTNVEAVTAWKSGLFYFENTPFTEVMQQIARWYDIEIVYKGKIPQKSFSGEMTRDVSLASVLRFIKGSGIHFQMEGRKLMIE